MIIFKVNTMLRGEDLRKVELDIRRQLPTGTVVVPACVEVMVTPPDDSGCVFMRADEAKNEPYYLSADGVAYYGSRENG